MLVALLGVVAAPARPAAAAPDGQLTVRAIASACGFRNLTTQLDVCLDLPGVWYPSEVANFWAIQNGGPNTPDCDITQVTEAAANIGPTPTSTGVFECNGRDHDTANLLASIFTGTANGHPDIPASLPAEWGVRQSNTCTVSRALLTDLSGGTCGVGATGYSQGDWYVLEGYLYLPQVASGQVTIRASNLDFGGTARAEYVAFMISSDDKLENLQFLGEAQTAFQREALIDFTIPVGDDVGASCASDVRAFRLFLFDNTDASAATLTWDIGDGFEEIPSSAFGTSADQAEICAPPTASDDADTTSRGIPVTIDVLSNDAPGDPSYPLVPTSVQLIDPSTSNPVSSVTVPG